MERGLGPDRPVLSHSIPAAHPAAVIFLVNKLIICFGFFFFPSCLLPDTHFFEHNRKDIRHLQDLHFFQLAWCFSYLFFIEGIRKKIFQLLFPISFH